jgi:hypothetical protein
LPEGLALIGFEHPDGDTRCRSHRGKQVDTVLSAWVSASIAFLAFKRKPIGVLELLQTSKDGKERNDRVFAVPLFESELQDVRRLPARAVDELEKYSKQPMRSKKKLEFLGWRPANTIKSINRLSR